MAERARLGELISGQLATGFAAGKSDQIHDDVGGVVQLRPTNIIPNEGISFEDVKRVPLESFDDGDVLRPGEVLFNNTNSTAWVGKTALFLGRGEEQVVCSNHITRIRPNGLVSGEFLVAVLNMMQRAGYFARLATNFNNQAGINAETLAGIVIPLGSEEIRAKALGALDAARAARLQRLKEADNLLSGVDGFVLDRLGLTLPQSDGPMEYAIRLGDACGRFDAEYHSPRFRALRHKIEHGKYKPRTIQSVCKFPRSGFAAGEGDQTDDPSIGVAHIRPLNISNTAELHFDGTKMVPRSAVEPDDFLRQGEVLFNNTNSTAWVGKSVVFDADRECACSNHITRLSLADEDDTPYFLAAVLNALRGLGYFGILSTNFNNQAGINMDTLNAIRIPWPDPDVQAEIASEVARRRENAHRLRDEAISLWEHATVEFEGALLGPTPGPSARGTRR